jgi:HK97 family phage major capsid protein
MPAKSRQKFSPDQNQTDVENVGRSITEGARNPSRKSVKQKYEDLAKKAEAYEEQKEVELSDGTVVNGKTEAFSDDTDLYSTLQADMIEEALEPQLLAQDAIRAMDFNLNQGFDSIQIPTGNQLSAVDLNSDGTLSEDTTQYDSVTISIGWVGVRTTFSHQIVEKAAVDLLAYRLEQAGRAIARRVDSDILTQIEKAGTKGDADYGDNSNYVYTGTGTDATYNDVIDIIRTGIDNDAMLDMGILSAEVWGTLHKDSDVKDVLAFTATAEGDFSMVQNFGPLRLMASSQVTADKGLFVDSDRTAMFVDASPVETFDGRVSEAAQFEILAVKGYGVKILQPKSVAVLHQDADQPA